MTYDYIDLVRSQTLYFKKIANHFKYEFISSSQFKMITNYTYK